MLKPGQVCEQLKDDRMLKSLPTLSAVALVALGLPALAQTTEDTTEDAPESVQAENPTNPVMDLGQPVANEPQPGQRYSKSQHGDWELACVKLETGTDPCSLMQVLNGPDGNPMAEFSMFRLGDGGQAAAGATIIVPLETLLPAQLTIAVDGAAGKRYNYSFCNQIGCVAQIGLTEADIAAFKKGNKATITIVPAPAPDKQIPLELSLSGFTAGYDVVDIVTN